MKKYLLMAVCITMMSMTASGVTINKAMLDHNGQVTLFDSDKVQDAVNAATDGDVIYLTLGYFKPFNVTKQIAIKGVGEKTIIEGDVNISIPGSAKLTKPVLEALVVSGTVTVGAQVDDMIFRKCVITNVAFEAQVDGAVIDRCYINRNFNLSSYIKGMTVVNSKILNVTASSGTANNTTFVNCNINQIQVQNFAGTIMNSIVRATCGNGSTGAMLSSTLAVLVNTLCNYSGVVRISTSVITQNVYVGNFTFNNEECSIDKSTLQSSGYLGTDGTVVGIYGGSTPFTLDPGVPKVTSSSLSLDKEKKELNVKLTVSPK
ncbi:MAG: hypothetical protein J5678_06235 [Bacteroidaceae bacterium]|nr:hypothetical protein [Bacteroidaceae bacterium]